MELQGQSGKDLILPDNLVTPAGFEPATCPLGGGCSIQLSHGADAVLLPGKAGIGKLARAAVMR